MPSASELPPALSGRSIAAVLFDRDGTLVVDRPILGDASAVRPLPYARKSVRRLRQAGLRVGVVSNQSGVGERVFSHEALQAVNACIDRMIGPFDAWCCCMHARSLACACRKPRPGLIYQAATTLAVDVRECVVVGDIGADVQAALAAGAHAILVPTMVTLQSEIAHAPTVAHDLRAAVDLILTGRP